MGRTATTTTGNIGRPGASLRKGPPPKWPASKRDDILSSIKRLGDLERVTQPREVVNSS